MTQKVQDRINISRQEIINFCQQNYIQELSVFGSVLREDFNKTSDIDFLVVFDPEIKLSLMDLVSIQYQLEDKIGRKVDLIEKRSIEKSHNWIRRQNILDTAIIIYESGQILSA
ncbi:MAG: nucleotidyltransferase domain-containing protein [Coleofasciculus sp. G3-WIS-01]|uniref:nucleotidyltransferase family protein n=1 Tax=Coleofasciculus sp. G3-WIS-01 TaxID=3069528 RepID=UPI0032F45B19